MSKLTTTVVTLGILGIAATGCMKDPEDKTIETYETNTVMVSRRDARVKTWDLDNTAPDDCATIQYNPHMGTSPLYLLASSPGKGEICTRTFNVDEKYQGEDQEMM